MAATPDLLAGLPVWTSGTVPSGTGWPELWATRVLPSARWLVAKSARIGGPPGRGKAAQNGFVPMRASAPPNGAT